MVESSQKQFLLKPEILKSIKKAVDLSIGNLELFTEDLGSSQEDQVKLHNLVIQEIMEILKLLKFKLGDQIYQSLLDIGKVDVLGASFSLSHFNDLKLSLSSLQKQLAASSASGNANVKAAVEGLKSQFDMKLKILIQKVDSIDDVKDQLTIIDKNIDKNYSAIDSLIGNVNGQSEHILEIINKLNQMDLKVESLSSQQQQQPSAPNRTSGVPVLDQILKMLSPQKLKKRQQLGDFNYGNPPEGLGKTEWRPATILKSGSVYEGEWREGTDIREGKGILIGKSIYEGWYLNDIVNGYGRCVTSACDVQVGVYKDNKLNGKGIIHYNNGTKYEGDFVDDKFEGQGTYYFKNGQTYEGEWKDDKEHGTIVITEPNGKKTKEKWENGKFISLVK